MAAETWGENDEVLEWGADDAIVSESAPVVSRTPQERIQFITQLQGIGIDPKGDEGKSLISIWETGDDKAVFTALENAKMRQQVELGQSKAEGIASLARGAFPLTAMAYEGDMSAPKYAAAALGDAALWALPVKGGQAVAGGLSAAGRPLLGATLGTGVEALGTGAGIYGGREALGGEGSLQESALYGGGVVGGNLLGGLIGKAGGALVDMPMTPQKYNEGLLSASKQLGMQGAEGYGPELVDFAARDVAETPNAIGSKLMRDQGNAYGVGQDLVKAVNQFDEGLYQQVAEKLDGKFINLNDAYQALEEAKIKPRVKGAKLTSAQEMANARISEYQDMLGDGFAEGSEAWELRKDLDAGIDWDAAGIDRNIGSKIDGALKKARSAIQKEIVNSAGVGPEMAEWSRRLNAQSELAAKIGRNPDKQVEKAESFVRNLYGQNKTGTQNALADFDAVFGTQYTERTKAAAAAEKLGVGPILDKKMTQFPAVKVRMDTDANDVVGLMDAFNPSNILRKFSGDTKIQGTAAYQIPRVRRMAAQLEAADRGSGLMDAAVGLGDFMQTSLAPIATGATLLGSRSLSAGIFPTPSGEEY